MMTEASKEPRCRYCGGSRFRAWYPVDEGQGIDVWREPDGSIGFEYNGDIESGESGADTEYWCLECDRSARTLEYLVGDTDEDETENSVSVSRRELVALLDYTQPDEERDIEDEPENDSRAHIVYTIRRLREQAERG